MPQRAGCTAQRASPFQRSQPDCPVEGAARRQLPSHPACIPWAGVGPYPKAKDRGAVSSEREKWTQDKARGVGMQASLLRPAGEGLFGGEWQEQMLNSCRQREGQGPEKRAQAPAGEQWPWQREAGSSPHSRKQTARRAPAPDSVNNHMSHGHQTPAAHTSTRGGAQDLRTDHKARTAAAPA